MAKKIVRFDEEDLKVIFKDWMPHSGFMSDDQEIVGFTFKTRAVKAGGKYSDPVEPGDEVELIRWVKVHLQDKKERAPKDEPETEEPS